MYPYILKRMCGRVERCDIYICEGKILLLRGPGDLGGGFFVSFK